MVLAITPSPSLTAFIQGTEASLKGLTEHWQLVIDGFISMLKRSTALLSRVLN